MMQMNYFCGGCGNFSGVRLQGADFSRVNLQRAKFFSSLKDDLNFIL